jgi:hypothetical protein
MTEQENENDFLLNSEIGYENQLEFEAELERDSERQYIPEMDIRDEYDHNIATVKRFRGDFYRITLFRLLRKPTDDPGSYSGGNIGGGNIIAEPIAKVKGAHEKKLLSSLSRSRSMVFQYAICNPWTYFFTGTLDSTKLDRGNLKAFQRKLGKFINNYNSNRKTDIKYLLVPELHKDGKNWHIHGLIQGLPENYLRPFALSEKLPRQIKKLLRGGRQLYDWPDYASAFGWASMEKIGNPEAVAHYISKYISKNIGNKLALNDHIYYCSKGLKHAEVIYKGYLQRELDPDYLNEYIAIKTIRSEKEAMRYFTNSNE